jgi:signal transduction histidine kinase
MPPVEDAAIERAVRSFAAAMLGLAAHELNNRLAVMRETVGLMEDLARAGKAGVAGTARAHASLDDQVGRALNIVRTLSGLGGALGAGRAGFDAGAAVGDLVGLTERWARQKSLRIEREVAADLPRTGGDPALFLCLMHHLLTGSAEALQPGGSILLRVVPDGAAARVSLHSTGKRAETAAVPGTADDEINRELAHRLGGELLFEGGGVSTVRLAALLERSP